MRTLILLSTAAALLAVPARADQIDKEKLRKAAAMPVPFRSLFLGFYFPPDQGPRMVGAVERPWLRPTNPWLSGEPLDVPAEIARLEQTLKDHPDDADAYYHLGQLRHRQKEEESSQRAYTRAAELFRQQAASEPANGRPLAGLSKSLQALKREQEAETAVREAVKRTPQDWECWLALRMHLERQATQILRLNFPNQPHTLMTTSLESFRQSKVTREDAERANKLLEEAEQCVAKALACAPREPRVLSARVAHRALSPQIRFVIDRTLGKEPRTPASMFSDETTADLRKIADLSPQDPHAQAVPILWEGMRQAESYRKQQPGSKDRSAIPDIPEDLHKPMKIALKRLTKIAKGTDASADVACIYLAVLRMDDPNAGEAAVREALRRAPRQEFCWDLLLTVLEGTRQHKAAVALCKERLKQKDCVYNRYLLAYCYHELEQFDRAEKQVRLALQQEPGDALALLGLAALLLRRSEEPTTLKEAAECLKRAEQALKGTRGGLWNDYTLLCGICLGLAGRVEGARRFVAAAQSTDPENQQAQAAMKALGEAPASP